MAEPMPRLKRVKATDAPCVLEATWIDGRVSVIDMTGVVARIKAFAPLADPDTFRSVKLIERGHAVAWSDALDYSASSLDRLAAEQTTMTAAQFVAWQRGLRLSIHETADLFGLSPGTIKNYRRGSKIPMAVQIACRALAENKTAFHAHFRPRRSGRPRLERTA